MRFYIFQDTLLVYVFGCPLSQTYDIDVTVGDEQWARYPGTDWEKNYGRPAGK